MWCGQPFLGAIVGAAFPLNWPFFNIRTQGENRFSMGGLNWYFVFLHSLMALFAYWLCRELGASGIASLLGGVAYSFTGFTGLTIWPEVVGSLVVAPLVFLFLVRFLKGERKVSSAALSGMFLGIAWLAGHHEVPIYLSFAVGAVCLYAIVRPGAERWRSIGLSGLLFLVAALTSGLQTLPGYEYAKLASRWVGLDHPVGFKDAIPYAIPAQNSLSPASLLEMLFPWLGARTEAFVGVVALSLALIAVVGRRQDRFVRLFAGIAAGALLLAFGSWDFLHGIFYSVVPLFGKARIPYRILSLFDLGIAVLAALGLDAVRESACLPVARIVRRALIAMGVGVFALGFAMAAVQKTQPNDYAYMAAFIALLLAGLFAARQRDWMPGRTAAIAALFLILIELGNVSPTIYLPRAPGQRQSFLPELSKWHDIAEFLRAQPQPVRIAATEITGAFNFGEWESLDTLTGYGAGLTNNIIGLNWPSVRTQNLLGVGYSLSTAGPRPDQQLVFHSAAGVNVYRNNDAFPRAWIVHRAESAPSSEQLNNKLNDPSFDARSTVLLVGAAPALETCEGSEDARVVGRTANTVTIKARLACRGMVELSETWYPGWQAEADGRRLPIYQANSALRGVVLEPGEHTLKYRYRPLSALLGGILSLTGVLGACALCLWDNRRAAGVKSAQRRKVELE